MGAIGRKACESVRRASFLLAMNEAEAYCPSGVGLPTVAHDRGHGITSIRVYCSAGLVCAHWRGFTFDELAVPDGLAVIHIPRVRRFFCTRSGSRKVQVRSEWPERESGGPFYSLSMDRASHVVDGRVWNDFRLFLVEVVRQRSFNKGAKRSARRTRQWLGPCAASKRSLVWRIDRAFEDMETRCWFNSNPVTCGQR
jgi:hypothetical protein